VALDDKTENGKARGRRGISQGRVLFVLLGKAPRRVVYPVVIKLPEKLVEMKGKVTWSNLDNCASLHFSPAMGFYFMRIDEEKDKQILREAILYQGKKPPRLQEEADGPTDPFPQGKRKKQPILTEPPGIHPSLGTKSFIVTLLLHQMPGQVNARAGIRTVAIGADIACEFLVDWSSPTITFTWFLSPRATSRSITFFISGMVVVSRADIPRMSGRCFSTLPQSPQL